MRTDCLIRSQEPDQIAQYLLSAVVSHLTSSRRRMPAATVLEHQVADVGFAAAIENRLARSEYRVLLLQSPQHMNRNVGFRVKRIQQESIARVDRVFFAQV